MNIAPPSRKLLVSCFAAAGLAGAASPASADFYELTYTTPSQSGDIFFQTLGSGYPATIAQIAAPGTAVGNVTIGQSVETTSGTGFLNDGVPQTVSQIIAPGQFNPDPFFPGNFVGGLNDNQLLTFSNDLHTSPPSSNADTTWFNSNGFAFLAADNTQVNVYVSDQGNAPRFSVDSLDINGNYIAGQGSAVLTDLGSPGPAPGAGFLGLFGLALGAAALKLRERGAA